MGASRIKRARTSEAEIFKKALSASGLWSRLRGSGSILYENIVGLGPPVGLSISLAVMRIWSKEVCPVLVWKHVQFMMGSLNLFKS